MGTKMAHAILVIAITGCIIVVAYSVAMLASAGQHLAFFLAAIGAGILAWLVMVGMIDADRADDGLFTSILSLLPKIMLRATTSNRRALRASLFLVGLAAVCFWIGPAGLGSVAVACGEARKIMPIAGTIPVECNASHSEQFWRSPFKRTGEPLLTCFDAALVQWEGEWSSPGLGNCGQRPREARFAQVGIAFPEGSEAGTTEVEARNRAAFERLSNGLASNIPQVRNFDDTLLFATWNIRWLGQSRRLEISYAHIAQIISYFDIVAFQELQSQDGLDKILGFLGPDWQAEYGLESPSNMGNRERLGFLFDRRKVQVDPVSSNMVLTSSDLRHTTTGQPARPPFVAAFSVNGRKILIANTHIVQGRPDARHDRTSELKAIAQNVGYHAEKSFGEIPSILVGTFGADDPDGEVIAAIEAADFFTDATLRSAASSVFTDNVYDQIFIREDNAKRLVFGPTGTFNSFDYIMRSEDMPLYKSDLARDTELSTDGTRNMRLFLRWRASEISDHRVKWAQFRMDW